MLISLATLATLFTHCVAATAAAAAAAASAVPKVAIIGAGPGGTASAFYLREFLAANVEITIFEKNDYVGGRAKSVSVHGDADWQVELGASIISSVNNILVQAAKRFELTYATSSKTYTPRGLELVSIWNGQNAVFTLNGTTTAAEQENVMVNEFGLSSLVVAYQLGQSYVETLNKYYYAAEFPYVGLQNVNAKSGFSSQLNTTGAAFLERNLVGTRYINEYVQAITRANYVSDISDIHAVGALTSLIPGSSFSVQGGNNLIYERFAKESGATVHLNTTVSSVRKRGTKWRLNWRKTINANFQNQGQGCGTGTGSGTGKGTGSDEYDYVIVAAPYYQTGLRTSFGSRIPKVEYRNLYVTLFASSATLSPEYFGKAHNETVALNWLTNPGARDFFSLTVEATSSKYGEVLYKIFSSSELDIETFVERKVLKSDPGTPAKVTWFYKKLWQSYPHLVPVDTFIDFEVAPNVFYLNTMESFVSCMEIAALAGANVAGLIAQKHGVGNVSVV